LASFFWGGSQIIISQSKTVDLPVIDISKTYPKIEKRLQDIADIEYIPLETTDDILLSDHDALSYVSDKYLMVHAIVRGDIFVFNRNGTIYSHFNHKGQSGREYSWIKGGVIFDENNEEIFVCSQSIQVYSLTGEYKRTLKINTMDNEMKVFNFDDEELLVYDDVNVDPFLKGDYKTNPYSLISKKDGSLISVLDIHLPKRYSTRIAQIDDKGRWAPRQIYYPCSMNFGPDFVIADISSDTLYLLTQSKELRPLLIRTPSVHSSEPRLIWVTFFATEKFVLIGKFPIDFNSRGGGGRISCLMYEFETGETRAWTGIDVDAEITKRSWTPLGISSNEKNMTAQLIWPSSIIIAYKTKQLKGDIEKIAMTLNEDDNPVVRIIKFKE